MLLEASILNMNECVSFTASKGQHFNGSGTPKKHLKGHFPPPFLHHPCLAYRLQPFLLHRVPTPASQTTVISQPDDYSVKLSAWLSRSKITQSFREGEMQCLVSQRLKVSPCSDPQSWNLFPRLRLALIMSKEIILLEFYG